MRDVGQAEISYFDVISLQPEGHVLETIFSKMQKKGQIETRLRAKYEYLIILIIIIILTSISFQD